MFLFGKGREHGGCASTYMGRGSMSPLCQISGNGHHVVFPWPKHWCMIYRLLLGTRPIAPQHVCECTWCHVREHAMHHVCKYTWHHVWEHTRHHVKTHNIVRTSCVWAHMTSYPYTCSHPLWSWSKESGELAGPQLLCLPCSCLLSHLSMDEDRCLCEMCDVPPQVGGFEHLVLCCLGRLWSSWAVKSGWQK